MKHRVLFVLVAVMAALVCGVMMYVRLGGPNAYFIERSLDSWRSQEAPSKGVLFKAGSSGISVGLILL